MSGHEDELHYITATDAVAKFRDRSLSPVELMNAVIDRIEDTNPAINCITYTYFDRAMEQARLAEQIYAKSPDDARPFEGIPYAVKDFHSVKGEITTYGSMVFRDFRPDQTAPCVERMLDAGAIMHCRTTTPEQAHTGTTKSPLWGTTRNPWNLEYNAGGSSGGSAAAVAAGLTTIADGTDGGGSIRIPSSACGVFGYKPPFGRNPLDREHPSEGALAYGPITRSVEDAARMQNVMSGQHPADIHSLRDQLILPRNYDSIRGMRIALSMDLGYVHVSEEVQEKTSEAAALLRELGCVVDVIELGWTPEIGEAWRTNWEGLFWSLAGDLLEEHREVMDPFAIQHIENGSRRTLKEFYGVKAARFNAYQELNRTVFESYDAMICPTLAVPAVLAEHEGFSTDFKIDGVPEPDAYLSWILTHPFNVLNELPVATVPTGLSPTTGVPTGMQIVGPAYNDYRVFQIASAFEQIAVWNKFRPSL